MLPLSTLLRHALRGLASALAAFVLWTFWLALAVVLGFQVYIAVTNRLEIPAWMLRAIEQRLALYSVNAKFGRTSLDPTGSLFFEDVSLELPSFHEPVITATGVFVRLDPWALLSREFQPREIRVTGANCLVPAMLSPSGQTEQLVRDFDLTLEPRSGGEIAIKSLSARVASLSITARGTLYLPESQNRAESPRVVAESIARRYTTACRQLLAAIEQLNAFESPSAEVHLVPSESRAAIANVTLTARSFKFDRPLATSASGLSARAQFPLLGDTPTMVRVEFTADELQLPRAIRAQGVRTALRGSLTPSRFKFEPTTADLTASLVQAEGITATAFAGHFTSSTASQLHAELVTNAMNSPLAITADVDFAAKTAAVRFDGAVAPAWLEVVSSHVGRDVRRFVDFTTPIAAEKGEAGFSAGWKFERLTARLETGSVNAYRVIIDAARGNVELTPRRFFAYDAQARLGKNFARGSYEHLIPGQEFRFLLEGQLSPLDISGWFGPWWPNFFQTFEFPGGPPLASVDVTGRWTEGRRTTVFVYADVDSPVIRGTRLDHVRSRLFIRPGFYDGLEVVGTLGDGVARGTFTYQLDPATFDWKRFDFAGVSSLALEPVGRLIGPISADWLKPFGFERPPAVKISGRLERRAADDYHQDVQIAGRSDGAFRFQDFPLERIAFNATLHDDEISVTDVEGGFAGGVITGRAQIRGRDALRRLNFELALREASLGRTIATLEEFIARKNGTPPPVAGKLIQEKNNVRLDLAGSAEGKFSDPLSYQGRGVADLKGPALGELRLLGGLSEALRFTALRFTAANTAFRIEGPKIVFPEVSITGDNSAIQAHGEYALDRKQLDFNAKLYPFQESGFVLKKILDVALSPLSNVFEVKLTGSLDKPAWSLVLGPTNFLRNLTQSNREETPPKPDESAGAPAVPTPAGNASPGPAAKP